MKNNKNDGLGVTVYQYLLDMILSMQIKPGDKIPESKIAATFGISRTPIREAMKQLANDGIINIYPNRFAEVALWDDARIMEIGVTRVHLDILAAKLAIHYGSNADFASMNELANECYKCAKNGDVAGRIKADCNFHLKLSEIGKNRQLIEIQRNTYLKIEFLQSWRGEFLQNPEEQLRQHQVIINELMQRDEKKLIETLTNHNMHFHDLQKEFSPYFFIKC